jgi:hypothetical protein
VGDDYSGGPERIMTDHSDKLWVQPNLAQLAINRAAQAIQNTGRSLPCRVTAVNGSIVTVAFEVDATPWTLPEVTIPKAESPWIRMPTQVGDKGYTVASDAYLGGVSGLGGGVATLTAVGNLSALVFVPLSNSGTPPIDQNAAQVQGPNGTILRTTTGTTSQIVTDQNGTTITYGSTTIVANGTQIVLTAGGNSITISSSGIAIHGAVTGNTTAAFTGDVTGSGTSLHTHVHSGVQSGGSNSGPPV